MSRPLRLAALVVLLLILAGAGALVYRSIVRWRSLTPEGYALLTPMPGSAGFEPKKQPEAPVLANKTKDGFSVEFGYKAGGVPHSYVLSLAFPAGAEKGTAKMTAREGSIYTTTETDAVRRWDEPRKSYAVALADKFLIKPAVPALCAKVVVGPDLARYDLSNASICVAQRDSDGICHPETLACGLIRP